MDAGVKFSLLQEFEIEFYVVRLATNFMAWQNSSPEHIKGRKPTYGALVRPWARKHKQKILEATAPGLEPGLSFLSGARALTSSGEPRMIAFDLRQGSFLTTWRI